MELIQAALAPLNLPWTILLGLIVFYWLFVILGALDISFLDFDLDLDADAQANPGFFGSFLQFLNLGEIPVMLVMSFLALFGWIFSILANYFFNPALAVGTGLLLLIPVLFIAVIITHYVSKPFKHAYRMLDKDQDNLIPLVGQVCQVISGEASADFGQGLLDLKGVPYKINIRTSGDEKLTKGEQALIVDEDKETRIFKVRKYEQSDI